MNTVVLVTGASKGIGAANVDRWIRKGALVIASSRTKKNLEASVRKYAKGRVFPVVCDVTSPSSVKALFRTIKTKFKRLDVLVNNAGIGYFEPIEKITLDHWQTTINTILTGTFLMTKAMLPLLKKSERAHIFNICSTASKKGFMNCGSYSAAKFGQLGFTEVLREEVRPMRIKVTAIIPGAVDTPFWEKQTSGFDRSIMLHAADVAEAIIYAYEQTKNNLVEEIVLKPACGDL
ncbi:SDR family NAD(P)-dependent oxidoreductase [bacterium]|nr:SDR family NAD(P)-dependent oxidoreductase [bacterium]